MKAFENDAAVSVVVPVFNGNETLSELVRRIEAVLSPMASYEVILVDDGSVANSEPRWSVRA